MNRAIIIGNLTRDPEKRTTQSGIAVTTFTVAVQRQRERDKADFLNVVTWRQTAEACAKYLAKGRKVGIVGSIQTRSWEDNDGNKRYATEIIADEVEFLSANGAEAPAEAADDDGELPF